MGRSGFHALSKVEHNGGGGSDPTLKKGEGVQFTCVTNLPLT